MFLDYFLESDHVQPDEGPFANAMVINGHGHFTERKFALNGDQIYTPDSLDHAYKFSIDREFALEPSFRQGLLYPVQGGQWQQHQQLIKDVDIKPWRRDETKDFLKRLATDNSLWSHLDNQHGLLLERDPNACMLVKAQDGCLKVLRNDEITQLRHHDLNTNMPIAFYSPATGKVKILSDTTLQEILQGHKLAYGSSNKFLLGTCNSKGPSSKIVRLQHQLKPTPIKPNKEILTSYFATQHERKTISSENALDHTFKKLTL